MLIRVLLRVTLTSLNISKVSFLHLSSADPFDILGIMDTRRDCFFLHKQFSYSQSSCDRERYWIVYWIMYIFLDNEQILWYACSAKCRMNFGKALWDKRHIDFLKTHTHTHTHTHTQIANEIDTFQKCTMHIFIYVENAKRCLFSIVMFSKHVARICSFLHIAESDLFYRFYNVSYNVHYSVIRMYILKHARYVTCYQCYMCRGTFDIWHIVEYVYKGVY